MKYLMFFSVVLFFPSCIDNSGYKYNGDLPDIPENLEAFNSEYDDYNSTSPSLGRLIPFCFSSNRNSHGSEFDIIYMPMNINFDRRSGELKVTNNYDNRSTFINDFAVLVKCVRKIKTSGNEFGPNLLVTNNLHGYDLDLMYASDITGNFDISFTSKMVDNEFTEPKLVEFLNSSYDDFYPSFNLDKTKLYFCSNRENDNFDIYYAKLDNPDLDYEAILSDSMPHTISKEIIMSSEYDDKCPFVFYKTMIFTSNRPGGYGGYDLYYCTLDENNEWSQPINFGSDINTEYDEYRPILIDEDVSFKESMMVFSSNRPGGKGGFDLYFVGVEILPTYR